MAVKIRLRKISDTSKKRYNFRISVIDGSGPRDGRVIEELGYYDPAKKPASLKIDKERVAHWVKLGAQVSPTVKSLVKKMK
jgi:small subunit ribosomal protein S16